MPGLVKHNSRNRM